MKNLKKLTFSTYLTLLRLVVAPIIIPFLIVYYLSQNDFFINVLIAILFLLFGLTDFFDGFFARKYGQETKIGATLDHLADKFLIFSASIALLVVHKIWYGWVLVLVGRELYMMGLREIALEHNFRVQVCRSAKLKTCVHIILIAWIIINPMQQQINYFWNGIEALLLTASLLLSISSAVGYSSHVYDYLKSR